MKLLSLILFSALAGLSYVTCLDEGKHIIYDLKRAPELFATFRHDYGKYYSSKQEEQRRFKIFKDNLKQMNKINSQHLSYYAKINQFADMTKEEVQKCCMGFNPTKSKKLGYETVYKPKTRMVILDTSLDDSSGSS